MSVMGHQGRTFLSHFYFGRTCYYALPFLFPEFTVKAFCIGLYANRLYPATSVPGLLTGKIRSKPPPRSL